MYWFNCLWLSEIGSTVSPYLKLYRKLRILCLIPSNIKLYCCCSLCRIFKASSDFFAVIGSITNSLKMLEKLCHGKYNFWSYHMGIKAMEMSSAKNK